MRSGIFSNMTEDERESILSFRCEYPQLRGLHDVLTQKILASNDVLDITGADRPILIQAGRYYSNMVISGMEDKNVQDYKVAFNFFDFFKGQTLLGDVSEGAMNYEDAVVVNKNFLKLFPDESVTGKTFLAKGMFDSNYSTFRIVGVIDNIQLFSLAINDGIEEVYNIAENDALFFHRLPERRSSNDFYVKYKSGRLKATKQHIEACLREFIPESSVIEFKTLQEQIDSTFTSEKLISYSSAILLLVSLILGLLNVYSSVLMSVEKRRKEIAIRKIHGAGLKDIIVLMGKRYFISWTLACIISFPFIYFYAMRWLERYKEPVNLNLLLFVANYAVILILIALTVISQIVKTAKSNPTEVIVL